MENLARYIIRASFSQERMTYLPEESKITYRSKDNRQEKTFQALDWLAAMCSHIPDPREQMVRYYGFHSNASRWQRQKENIDGLIPCVVEPDEKDRPKRRGLSKLEGFNPPFPHFGSMGRLILTSISCDLFLGSLISLFLT